MWPHKNHHTLFTAFVEVIEAIPEAKLVLTGLDELEISRAKQEVDRFGLTDGVLLFPRIPRGQLNSMIKSSRALLMPSLLGPTNYPPLEAMQIGARALISDAHLFDFELPNSVRVIPSRNPEAWSHEILRAFRSSHIIEPVTIHDQFSAALAEAITEFSRDWKLWSGHS